jgi:hypothetical protein
MNRSETVTRRGLRAVGSILLALLLFAAFAAAGQEITVTAADPPETEQGTLSLVVKIAGANFGKDSKVSFLVAGSTDPGGITVKSVKYRNPKSLEATIDVAPDAQTQNRFDIQVQSGGRTGKGTELFKVLVKVTGGDITPPGTITDLRVIAGSVGYNTAVVEWTAPANNGFLESSGPATQYDIRVRKDAPECGGPFTMAIWVDSSWTGPHADPCHAFVSWPAAGATGTTESRLVNSLAPDTWYWAAVRARDDSPQGSNWSLLPDPSQQLHFTTGPAPETAWSTAIVDACPVTGTSCSMGWPRLAFDSNGNPALLYNKGNDPTLATWIGGTWPTDGSWQFEIAPAGDGGNGAVDLAFDPATGEPAIASYVPSLSATKFYRRTAGTWQSETVATGFVRSLEFGFAPPTGADGPVPTVVYTYEKGKSTYLKVAQKVGASWITDTVASGVTGGSIARVHLAFDAVSDPAVAFIQDYSGGRRLVLASRKGATWTVDPLPDAPAVFQPNTLQFAELAFNPARGTFSVVGQHLGPDYLVSQVRYCEGNVGSWSCLPDPLFQWDGRWQAGLSLAAGDEGSVYVGTLHEHTLTVLARDPATLTWVTEFVDWNAAQGPQDLHFGPGGRPTIVYRGLHDSSGAGGSDGNGSEVIAQRPPQ